MDQIEVTIERDQLNECSEEGVDVPLDRINPETVRKMVEEFVTREWSDLSDADCTFKEKVEQVMQQLKDGSIKIVFDLTSETCNIIPVQRITRSKSK
ncbi:MAG TPA: YheU family protein [Desulfuromonadales bacterium]|nr:YheU family protein [Desulfuromonadales bacterium]